MMISPITYVEELKDAEYKTLIKERNKLIRLIVEFEGKEKDGDRSGNEWNICPNPDVQYQLHLGYLSELCNMMKGKYCEEYVWAGKSLSVD